MDFRIALIWASIGAALTLAGCSPYSSADLRAKEPVFSGSTTRPLPQYAGCVQEGWLSTGISSVNFIPKDDGVSLSVNGIVGSDLLLDAKTAGDTARVLMFSRLPYGYSRAVSEAQKCL